MNRIVWIATQNPGANLRGAALLGCLLLNACRHPDQEKEKVQQAIVDRLEKHSGLDVKSLDITTTAIRFEKNLAYATVSFHPKGDTSLASGMVMKYTLRDNNGQWVVTKVGDSQEHSMSHGHDGAPGGAALPPGHPQLQDSPQPAASGNSK